MGGPQGRRTMPLTPSPPRRLQSWLLLVVIAVQGVTAIDQAQLPDLGQEQPMERQVSVALIKEDPLEKQQAEPDANFEHLEEKVEEGRFTENEAAVEDAEAAAEANSTGLSHLPAEALARLQSLQQTLPYAFYQFSGISIGQQLYPAAARFTTVTSVSACHCRHLCLAESRCLGYEHDASSSSCGLVDVLLPADEARDTADGWSSGRRRGASWLAQPCATDADCRLLVTGAVQCGQQEAGSPPSTCSCRPGWRPAGPLACQRHGGRWVALTSTLLAGQPRRRHQQQTLGECQQACARSVECWALQFSEGECRQYDTAEQSPAPQPPPPQVTGYVWQFDREDGSPPAGYTYTELNGTWLRRVFSTGSNAAIACLNQGGIRYVPANPEELKSVYEKFRAPGTRVLGIGVNDLLKEGSFVTVNGDVLNGTSWWADGQPQGGNHEDCVCSYAGWQLHDINCDQQAWQMCEFVGEDLLSGVVGRQQQQPPSNPAAAAAAAAVWRTYDLGSVQQVSRLLYVADRRAASEEVVWTELRVGSAPADPASAALCHRQQGTFVAVGFSRRLTCHVPLAGRYLHVGQANGSGQKLWQRIAAFGNRYPENGDVQQ